MSLYYQNDWCSLYQGDCVQLLHTLPAASVDVIFANPPYHLSNGGKTYRIKKVVDTYKGEWDKSKGFEADVQFHRAWLTACRRVLKPTGTIWVSGTYHSIYQCGYVLQQLGFRILNEIVWYKPNATPNFSCRRFTHSHETLIWACNSLDAKYYFNYDYTKHGNFPNDQLKVTNKQMRSVWSIHMTPKQEK